MTLIKSESVLLRSENLVSFLYSNFIFFLPLWRCRAFVEIRELCLGRTSTFSRRFSEDILYLCVFSAGESESAGVTLQHPSSVEEFAPVCHEEPTPRRSLGRRPQALGAEHVPGCTGEPHSHALRCGVWV